MQEYGLTTNINPINSLQTLTIHHTNLQPTGMNLFHLKTLPAIDKVIFQNEYTIIVWEDKERTVVKCSEENFDKEKGLAMGIAKRYMDRNKFKKLLETAEIQERK